MPTKTYSETTCQGCGKVVKREGEWIHVPPSWMEGQLVIIEGEDEVALALVKVKQCVDVDALCVACGDKLLAVVGVKRKRQRRDSQNTISVSQVPEAADWQEGQVSKRVAEDVARRYASFSTSKVVEPPEESEYVLRPAVIMPKAMAEPSTTTVAMDCPHSIETPHVHHEHGDEVVCVEPAGGWPVNEKP